MFNRSEQEYILEHCKWKDEVLDENTFIDHLYWISSSLKKVDLHLDTGKLNYSANLARALFESFDDLLLKDMDKQKGYELFKEHAFNEYLCSFVNITTELWLYVVIKTIEDESLKPDSMDVVFERVCFNYPVWARQLVVLVLEWRQNLKEIIYAGYELKENSSYFFDDTNCLIQNVSGGESDIHNHGRCVHIFTLENGKKIVYKPRSMAIDRAVDQYIRFMCKKAGLPEIPSPKNIDISVGALCEFIEFKPVDSFEEVKEYFVNLGFLAGIFYILNGYDFHKENIIAHGKYPVIIDNETSIGFDTGVIVNEPQEIDLTIANMSLLPAIIDIVGEQILPFSGLVSVLNNLPEYNGKVYTGMDQVEDLLTGFDMACHTIEQYREEIKDFVKKAFTGKLTRILYRATMDYYRMRKILETPKALRSSKNYEMYLHTIKFTRFNANNRKEFQNAVEEMEYEQFKRLDIPAYSFYPDENSFDGIMKNIDDFDQKKQQSTHTILAYTLHHRPERKHIISFSDIKALKDELLSCINNQKNLMLYVDEEYYMSSDFPLKLLGLMAVDMGVVISLAAYLKIHPEDALIKELMNEYIEQIEDTDKRLMCQSSFYFGLSSGASGFLFGLYILYKMDMISKETFYKRVHQTFKYVPVKLRLHSLDVSIDRGLAGLYWFVSKLDPECLSEEERNKIRDVNEVCASLTFTLPSIDRKSIYIAYRHMPDYYVPVDFFYGIPGVLYNECQKQNSSIPDLKELLVR